MIRFLRAFAWLRWRSMLNGLRSKRRDSLERLSRIAAVLAPAALLLLVLCSASGLGALAFVGGRLAANGSAVPGGVLLGARFVLLGTTAMLLLMPLGGSARAGSPRLLLLPIPREALHVVEVLASLADPWIVLVLPALVLLPTGILFGGDPVAAAMALVAALALLAVFVSLGSLAAFAASWLMRNRKRGEVFVLVSVLLVSLLAIVPAVSSDALEDRLRVAGGKGRILEAIDGWLPWWTAGLPSEAFGRSVGAALGGRFEGAALGVAILCLEAAGLFALSAAVHHRLLDSSGSERARRKADPSRSIGMRIPGTSPVVSAVATAQFLTAMRSVRGRLVVLMPGPLLALLTVAARKLPDEIPGGAWLGSYGYAALGGGAVFCLYAMQAFHMNQFASDRAGLTMQFLAPIRDEDLVRGKALGCAMILGVGMAICFFCALAVSPASLSLAWLTVVCGAAATYLLLCPVAVVLSAVLPRASDLSKTGSGGNPHGLAFFLGTLGILAFAAPSGVILAVWHHAQDRPGLALGLTAIWALLAALVSRPLLRLASGAVESRRENLSLVSQGR